MRKRIILTCAEDGEFGGYGLLLPGMHAGHDVNPAADGLLLAHDLLEHQNGVAAIGGIDDELEALGGIWYVRGQFDDISRDGSGSAHTTHQNIAGDVVRMFRDYFCGVYVNTTPPRTRALPEADDDFREIIAEALKQTRGEVDREDATPEEIAQKEAAYIAVCLPRMRIGYRKAARRFKDARTANRLFWDVTDAVNRAIGVRSWRDNDRGRSNGLDYEGQQFELSYTYDPRTGDCAVRCDEHYPEE